MLISISNTITHESPCAKKSKLNDEKIKQIIFDSCDNLGLNPADIAIQEDGVIKLLKPDNLKLHTLMLRLEEHGLDLKLTKQTLIEVA